VYTTDMNKSFWAIIAVIVVIFGGILVFNNKDASAPDKGGSSSNAKPTEHFTGNTASKVTFVEYGDYQCPYCGEFEPGVEATIAKYKDQVKFQFRNLPLLQVHKNAFAAARAAEAADMQGKFWEMHNVIYSNQNAWSESNNPSPFFEQYAKSLGLNVTKFKTDAASSKVNGIINADIKAFEKTGAEKSTPTFFLNGKKVQPNGFGVEDFSKIIDPVLAQEQ
jgi:protein-disulfide isomerase